MAILRIAFSHPIFDFNISTANNKAIRIEKKIYEMIITFRDYTKSKFIEKFYLYLVANQL